LDVDVDVDEDEILTHICGYGAMELGSGPRG
jgi:hypothetical protein